MGRKEFYRSRDSKDSWLVREDSSSKCSGHCTYDSDGSLLRWDNYSGYNGASTGMSGWKSKKMEAMNMASSILSTKPIASTNSRYYRLS